MKGKSFTNNSTGATERVDSVDASYVYFESGNRVDRGQFLSHYSESGSAPRRGYVQQNESYGYDEPVDPEKFFSTTNTQLLNKINEGSMNYNNPSIRTQQEQQYAKYERESKIVNKSPFVVVKGDKAVNVNRISDDPFDTKKKPVKNIASDTLMKGVKSYERSRDYESDVDMIPFDDSPPKPLRKPVKQSINLQNPVVVSDFDEDYTASIAEGPQQIASDKGEYSSPAEQGAVNEQESVLDGFQKDYLYRFSIPVKVKSFSPDLIKVIQGNIKGMTKAEVLSMIAENFVDDLFANDSQLISEVKKAISAELAAGSRASRPRPSRAKKK